MGPLKLSMAFSGCAGGSGHGDEDGRCFGAVESEQPLFRMPEPEREGIGADPRVGHHKAELRVVHALEERQGHTPHHRRQRERMRIFKACETGGNGEHPSWRNRPAPEARGNFCCLADRHA